MNRGLEMLLPTFGVVSPVGTTTYEFFKWCVAGASLKLSVATYVPPINAELAATASSAARARRILKG